MAKTTKSKPAPRKAPVKKMPPITPDGPSVPIEQPNESPANPPGVIRGN